MNRFFITLLTLLILGGCGETVEEPSRMYLDCEVTKKYQQLGALFDINESFSLGWNSAYGVGPNVLSYQNEAAFRATNERQEEHDDMNYRFYDSLIWGTYEDGIRQDTYVSYLVFTLNRITLQMTIEEAREGTFKNDRPTDEYNGLWYKYDCSEVERI
tara:strand:+ start:384 stop:857 length:474 start_codon:yes stop_codon:yes gene_type:complete